MTGSVTVNVAPRPWPWLPASAVPPCAATGAEIPECLRHERVVRPSRRARSATRRPHGCGAASCYHSFRAMVEIVRAISADEERVVSYNGDFDQSKSIRNQMLF